MIAVTLLVRDEIDIIRDWLRHHLPLADRFYITDNGSVDGTREVLTEWAKEYPQITIIDEPERGYWQNKWVDRMIRMAIADGAEWVANSDADEMWDIDFRKLARYGGGVDAWRIKSQLFVPTVDDDTSIASPVERMRWRVEVPRSENEWWCMRAWNKIYHKTQGFKANVLGNHDVKFKEKAIIKDAPEGCRIRHYPNRSWEQYRRKYIQGGEAYAKTDHDKAVGFHWRDRYQVYCTQGIVGLKRLWYTELEDDFDKLVEDSNACKRGSSISASAKAG